MTLQKPFSRESGEAVSSFGKKCTWILKKGRSMYKIYDLIIIAIQDFMR